MSGRHKFKFYHNYQKKIFWTFMDDKVDVSSIPNIQSFNSGDVFNDP
jgi:hypothetical protein